MEIISFVTPSIRKKYKSNNYKNEHTEALLNVPAVN